MFHITDQGIDKYITPGEAASLIIRMFIDQAALKFPSHDLKKAIFTLTVPAHFNTRQRNAMSNAARAAGMVRPIREI